MLWNNAYVVSGMLILSLLFSCDDILVEDISNNMVTLALPADSLRTSNQTLTFVWDELAGAEEYKLSIESNNAVVLDSTMAKSTITVQLPSGVHKWCVTGLNAGYQSIPNCRTLEILEKETVDISSKTVSLVAPAADLETKNKQHLFLWDQVDGAVEYRLLIVSPDLQAPAALVLDTLIAKNSFSKQLAAGQYEWCVRALNDQFRTAINCRKLTVNE